MMLAWELRLLRTNDCGSQIHFLLIQILKAVGALQCSSKRQVVEHLRVEVMKSRIPTISVSCQPVCTAERVDELIRTCSG